MTNPLLSAEGVKYIIPIAKLSDTMDPDNARALVEDVIREHAEHAHAATVAQLQQERNEAKRRDFDNAKTLFVLVSHLRSLIKEWRDEYDPYAHSEEHLKTCADQVVAILTAPSGATETTPQ